MKRERGQALILALILLALGSLLIVPLLQMVRTTVKSSTIYRQFAYEDYAADAALEYGLWRLNWEPDYAANLTVGAASEPFSVTINGVTATASITPQALGGPSGVGLVKDYQIKPEKTVTPNTASPGVPTTFTFTLSMERLEPDDAQFFLLASIKDVMDRGFVYLPNSSALDGVPFDDDDLTILEVPVITTPLGSLQWSRTANEDAMVRQDALTQNYGANLTMDVSSGVPSSNVTARSFLKFDTPSIPADSVIQSATLRLWATTYPGATRTYDLHLVTDNWTESSVSWNNTPAVAAAATASIPTPSNTNTPMEWNVTADVRDWRDGITTNYGWRISDNAEGFGTLHYANTVIDTLEFDTVQGKKPSIIPISGDVYAIAYEGSGSDGFLKTVEIATDGQITNTVIDTLEFDTVKGKEPDIIPISGDVYAIAYEDNDGFGSLKTVQIATNGQITNTVIDTLKFDTVKGKAPDIIPIAGDVYAIAYEDDDGYGSLKTVEIATDGQITNTVIDTLKFDTSQGKDPSITPVSGDVYAIAYEGSGSDGFLKTVEIATDGQITNTVIDTLEFDTVKGKEPDIIPISGDVYAIAYEDNDGFGSLKTVQIATNGQITNTVIDTLKFDTVQGKKPNIILVTGDVYAMAYEGSGGDGFLKTAQIATDGQITATATDDPVFDAAQGKDPNIIHISGDVYAIAYEGSGGDGFLTTVDIAFIDVINNTTVFQTKEDDDPGGKEPILVVDYILLGGSDYQTIEWIFEPDLDFDYSETRTLSFQAKALLADDTMYCNAAEVKNADGKKSWTGLTANVTVGTPAGGCPGSGAAVTKTTDPPDQVIYPGVPTLVTYTITMTNSDNGSFNRLDSVEDYLPPDFSYVVGSASAAWPNLNSTMNTWYPYNHGDFEPEVSSEPDGRLKLKWHNKHGLDYGIYQQGDSVDPAHALHDRLFPYGTTWTLTFQALANLQVSGSYNNEVIVKLKDWDQYGDRGIGGDKAYSWPTAGVVVPAYDILSETALNTLRANAALTLDGIQVKSWQWK